MHFRLGRHPKSHSPAFCCLEKEEKLIFLGDLDQRSRVEIVFVAIVDKTHLCSRIISCKRDYP
jgi:hypothetical protein